MEESLGLSPADEKLLCEVVSIVFHCAATVKFDEILRVSVQMNVIGTQRLVALCHKMSKLTVNVFSFEKINSICLEFGTRFHGLRQLQFERDSRSHL